MNMSKKILLALALTAGGVSLLFAAAQSEQKTKPQAAPQAKAESKVREAFSPDEVYKSNCTRCHSELPKVSERRTKTILRHMRVRANLTQAEAKAVYEYMTQ